MVKAKLQVVLVAHDIRSTYNVGSLLRTADGLGVTKVYLTGYTPYPQDKNDERLPHVADRAGRQIHKTALGAEDSVDWTHFKDINKPLNDLKRNGFVVVALEQSQNSMPLSEYGPPAKVALIVGSEVGGLDNSVLERCDAIIEIPMRGRKESFNVAAAAAMALYHLTNLDKPPA